MDAISEFVDAADISVTVLGDTHGNFLLFENGAGVDYEAARAAVARGFWFAGVLGLKDGVAGATCERDAESLLVMAHASLAWVQQVADKLAPPPVKGDAADYLEALYLLEDPRLEVR